MRIPPRTIWLAAAIAAAQTFPAQAAERPALLVGLESTRHAGETGPGLVIAFDAPWRSLAFEGFGSTMDKYTGAGWLGTAALEVRRDHFLAGARYTRRDGGVWAKDVVWLRAGIACERARLLAELAPASSNREGRIEGRLRFAARRAVLETRYWIQRYEQAGTGHAWGTAVLVGLGL